MAVEFDMTRVASPLLLHMLSKELRFPRVFLLLKERGGTAAQNLQFDTLHRERTFLNFADLEIENNRGGLVRCNTMQIVERTPLRCEIKVTRCMFHELATLLCLSELTPVVCQIDNAMFSSYLPVAMTLDRAGIGRRIADGKRECNFVWELRQAA